MVSRRTGRMISDWERGPMESVAQLVPRTPARQRVTPVPSGTAGLTSPARRPLTGRLPRLPRRKWPTRSIRYPRTARILRVSRILRAIPGRQRITRLPWHHAAHGHLAVLQALGQGGGEPGLDRRLGVDQPLEILAGQPQE